MDVLRTHRPAHHYCHHCHCGGAAVALCQQQLATLTAEQVRHEPACCGELLDFVY